MKTLMIIALILGTQITAFSQNNINEGNDKKEMKSVEPYRGNIKNMGKKFSYYLPDSNSNVNVKNLESDFIVYDKNNSNGDSDYSSVTLQKGKGILNATYDSDGKLISVEEKYYDIKLPMSILKSVYKAYPGWVIVHDKYTYIQKNGEITKKEYSLKLKKDNEIIRLKIDTKKDGDIVIANVD